VSWRRILRAVFVLPLVVAASAQAEGELGDLAARLQFHYYAGDARGLRQVLQTLQRLEVSPSESALKSYYLAYGNMSLHKATEGDKSDRSESRKAAGDCVKQADEVLDRERPRATGAERARLDLLYGELWAIKADCLGNSLFGSAGKARESAQALAPQSPRVQLLAALFAAQRADSPNELEAAARQMQAAAKAFQDFRAPALGFPDWGQAEAWAWLGHIQLQRGERFAAREALEHALVLAPDYAWAQQLRSRVASGR